MKRIVITGATSMIGSAIIRRALAQPLEVIYAVVRPNSNNLSHLPKDERIRIVECSVEHVSSLPELISEPCDTFYHIAWGLTGAKRNQDISGQAVNINYTVDAVKAAKALGCRRFIGAGSQAEYGHAPTSLISPATPTNPVQAYGIAKYAAGKLAEAEARLLGLNFFWVRIFSVYGPYDKPSTMISASLRKMRKAEHTSFTKGTQIWDYLYADDAGEAFVQIAKKAAGIKTYCLGSGNGMPLKDYITTMRDVVNPSLSIGLGEVPYANGVPLSICADISSLTEDTGWTPTTSFADGIRAMLSFMDEN